MRSEQSEIELDLPPEYCHYRDKGCEFADSCLNCPFPSCIYEQPGGKQRWLKRQRNTEMARLFAKGKKIKELAQKFGVSQRTVQRALKNYSISQKSRLLKQSKEGENERSFHLNTISQP